MKPKIGKKKILFLSEYFQFLFQFIVVHCSHRKYNLTSTSEACQANTQTIVLCKRWHHIVFFQFDKIIIRMATNLHSFVYKLIGLPIYLEVCVLSLIGTNWTLIAFTVLVNSSRSAQCSGLSHSYR